MKQQLFSGTSGGIFVQPDGTSVAGIGTSHFTWGDAPFWSGPNSFDFTPNSFSVQPGKTFSLGSLIEIIPQFFVAEGATDGADLIARFTDFDFSSKSLVWGGEQGGVSLTYEIKGQTLDNDITSYIKLSWESSSGSNLQNVDVSSITFPTSEGKHKINIPGSYLKVAPSGASRLAITFDSDKNIVETNEDNNNISVANVSLNRNASVKGFLSASAEEVLKSLLRESGESNATITSLQRSPEDQARVMFDNIYTNGVASQKKLYAAAGDSVIDIYSEKTKGMSKVEIIDNRAAIEKAMLDQINLVGPQKVSRHCSDPNLLQVIDLAPSSFSGQSRSLFVTDARQDDSVSKFLAPSNGDPAFHLEIPQTLTPDNGNHAHISIVGVHSDVLSVYG